jgi:hypothetical protein
MKVEDIQHGGDHYKDQPKHLQPIWLAIALNLNAMEYSVLKYLLRHRKKAGLEDLKKMVHFAQMLMEHEYGVCPVVVYPEQDSPSDVSGEEIRDVSDPETEDEQPSICPFKVGDIIRHLNKNVSSRWVVKEIDWEQGKMLVENVKSHFRGRIGKSFWNQYERVPDEPVRGAKDKLPQVGDRYKRLVEGTPLYRVLEVSDKGVVLMGREGSAGLRHYVEWEQDFDKYELQESPSTSRYPFVGEIYKRKDDGKRYRVYELKGNYVWFEDIKSGTIHVANWAAGRSNYYERVPDET